MPLRSVCHAKEREKKKKTKKKKADPFTKTLRGSLRPLSGQMNHFSAQKKVTVSAFNGRPVSENERMSPEEIT